MLEDVETILNSTDNIIDQLKLFRLCKHNKEVKRYMKTLMELNKSEYFDYCIKKYYLEKDIEEVPISINYYFDYGLDNYKDTKVFKLLKSTNDNLEAIKLLKKNNQDKSVKEYMTYFFYLSISNIPYVRYLILKYYYDLDVPDIPLTPKNLDIKLFNIHFKNIKTNKKFKKIDYDKNIQLLDKVEILDGPFKDLKGKIIANDNGKISCEVVLFDQVIEVELSEKTKLRKEKMK